MQRGEYQVTHGVLRAGALSLIGGNLGIDLQGHSCIRRTRISETRMAYELEPQFG